MSSIEWTDVTWNPCTGCDKISPGCSNCYALKTATRLKFLNSPRYQNDGSSVTSGPGFALTVHQEALFLPFRWRKNRKVFVSSMSDLFHAQVPRSFLAQIFAVMLLNPHHTFQILTKRPERMQRILIDPTFTTDITKALYNIATSSSPLVIKNKALTRLETSISLPLPNIWLGVSVETQKYTHRLDCLLSTPAVVHFVSCEPLLGFLDLTPWLNSTPCLNWVIAGGESGPKARPMHPLWVESIRDQCVKSSTAFMFKQWGQYTPLWPLDTQGHIDSRYKPFTLANDGTLYEPGSLVYPDGPRYQEALQADHQRANLTHVYKVGKKAAGRTLDNQVWDEYPVTSP